MHPPENGEKWDADGRRGKREGNESVEERGASFARKWTRIGALCENEKVTKAEGKDVHIYA